MQLNITRYTVIFKTVQLNYVKGGIELKLIIHIYFYFDFINSNVFYFTFLFQLLEKALCIFLYYYNNHSKSA